MTINTVAKRVSLGGISVLALMGALGLSGCANSAGPAYAANMGEYERLHPGASIPSNETASEASQPVVAVAYAQPPSQSYGAAPVQDQVPSSRLASRPLKAAAVPDYDDRPHTAPLGKVTIESLTRVNAQDAASTSTSPSASHASPLAAPAARPPVTAGAQPVATPQQPVHAPRPTVVNPVRPREELVDATADRAPTYATVGSPIVAVAKADKKDKTKDNAKDKAKEAASKSKKDEEEDKPEGKPVRKGATYEVESGDTIAGISRRFGVTWVDLKNKNKLDGDTIKPGMSLSFPDGARDTGAESRAKGEVTGGKPDPKDKSKGKKTEKETDAKDAKGTKDKKSKTDSHDKASKSEDQDSKKDSVKDKGAKDKKPTHGAESKADTAGDSKSAKSSEPKSSRDAKETKKPEPVKPEPVKPEPKPEPKKPAQDRPVSERPPVEKPVKEAPQDEAYVPDKISDPKAGRPDPQAKPDTVKSQAPKSETQKSQAPRSDAAATPQATGAETMSPVKPSTKTQSPTTSGAQTQPSSPPAKTQAPKPATPRQGPVDATAEAPKSSGGTANFPNAEELNHLSRGRFIWPVKGEVVMGFGQLGPGIRNDGIDLAAAMGTKVLASADGEVVYAGSDVREYGNIVLVRHADGWVSAYAYLDKIDVKIRQTVTQGETIGRVGKTGSAVRPQLHFELRYSPSKSVPARPVDPRTIIK